MKGSYILVMELLIERKMMIGKKKIYTFPAGWYVYIGSAMNGIGQRVKRHLSSDKKRHWHIDYFLQHAQIKEVFFKESSIKEECSIARKFIGSCAGYTGFGCSDCSCKSHLFHGSKANLLDIIDHIGCAQFA